MNRQNDLRAICLLNVLFIFFVVPSVASPGRAYYLSASGNDKSAGTNVSPWKTIGRVNRAVLSAGDSIIFAAGEHFTGTLKINRLRPGMAGTYLVITSDSARPATLEAKAGFGIILGKIAYIRITHLTIRAAGRDSGNVSDGIVIDSSRNILLHRLSVSGFQKAGVRIFASRFVRVSHVRATFNGFAGIFITGPYQQRSAHDVVVADCVTAHNYGDPTVLDNHSGNGILAGYCRNVIIERCKAYSNGWKMPRKGNGPVGIWCYEADSVIIQYCLSYGNGTSKGGEDGGGFDLDGGTTHSIIQYCISAKNAGSGFGIFQFAGAGTWHDNIVRYNLSIDDGTVSAAQAGVYVWSASISKNDFTNLFFYRNIIINSRRPAIHFAKNANHRNFWFSQNWFVSGGVPVNGPTAASGFIGNCWLNEKSFGFLFNALKTRE